MSSAESGQPSDLEAASRLLVSAAGLDTEPETWHGQPSSASLLLMPFGIAASPFIAAEQSVRDIVVDELLAAERRQFVRSMTLCVIVGLGFAAILDARWMLAAGGGVALKAGIDFGRFMSRRRVLEQVRHLNESHLEITRPAETA